MELIKDINYTERHVLNGHIYIFRVVTINDQDMINDVIDKMNAVRAMTRQPPMSEGQEATFRTRELIKHSITLVIMENAIEKIHDIGDGYFGTIPLMEYNELVRMMNEVNDIKKKSLDSSLPVNPEITGR